MKKYILYFTFIFFLIAILGFYKNRNKIDSIFNASPEISTATEQQYDTYIYSNANQEITNTKLDSKNRSPSVISKHQSKSVLDTDEYEDVASDHDSVDKDFDKEDIDKNVNKERSDKNASSHLESMSDNTEIFNQVNDADTIRNLRYPIHGESDLSKLKEYADNGDVSAMFQYASDLRNKLIGKQYVGTPEWLEILKESNMYFELALKNKHPEASTFLQMNYLIDSPAYDEFEGLTWFYVSALTEGGVFRQPDIVKIISESDPSFKNDAYLNALMVVDQYELPLREKYVLTENK